MLQKRSRVVNAQKNISSPTPNNLGGKYATERQRW